MSLSQFGSTSFVDSSAPSDTGLTMQEAFSSVSAASDRDTRHVSG
ncbi:hypothetical protein ABZY09_11610 [Streptomyces sp. NPDC002928]